MRTISLDSLYGKSATNSTPRKQASEQASKQINKINKSKIHDEWYLEDGCETRGVDGFQKNSKKRIANAGTNHPERMVKGVHSGGNP